MNARDTAFFLRYHNDKATELREGIMSVLRGEGNAITRGGLLAKLPEGAHTYVVSEQPKVLDVILGNLEAEGLVLTTPKEAMSSIAAMGRRTSRYSALTSLSS